VSAGGELKIEDLLYRFALSFKFKSMEFPKYSIRLERKDPGPEDPALISPQLPARRAYSSERGVKFTLESQWNNGMME